MLEIIVKGIDFYFFIFSSGVKFIFRFYDYKISMNFKLNA